MSTANSTFNRPHAQLPDPPSLKLHLKDLLAIITALGVAAGLIMTKIQIRATDFHVDMIIYRAGARAFLNNEPLYFQPFLAGDLGLPFIYPPFGALVLAPLTRPDWITDEDAAAFVVMLSSLCVAVCLFLVVRALIMRSSHNDPVVNVASPNLLSLTIASVLWPLALLTEPVWLNSQFAQINVILMALVVLDMLPRRRRLPQGWLIGVAAAIKLTPLVMLLYFLVRKDWRAIATTVVSALTMTAVAAMYSWTNTKLYFTEVIFAMGSGGEFGVNSAYSSNSSIRAALERWWPSEEHMLAHQHAISAWWLALSLVTIAAVFYIMRELIHRDLAVEAVMLNSALMLLISPVSWSHHWVWVPLWLTVLAWHWRVAGTRQLRRVYTACILVFAALVLFEPPKWWFGDGVNVWELELWKKIIINDYTIAAYLMFVVVFVLLRQRSTGGAKNPARKNP